MYHVFLIHSSERASERARERENPELETGEGLGVQTTELGETKLEELPPDFSAREERSGRQVLGASLSVVSDTAQSHDCCREAPISGQRAPPPFVGDHMTSFSFWISF